MILIDGVKYNLWTPEDEENEFHPMVKEHSKEIFGEYSIYFDIKHKLRSRSGIASIPDAYVVTLSKPYKWYIVENELASHPVYSHIFPQISKFISGVDNLKSQRDIINILYNEIMRDQVLKAIVETKIRPEETHRFLSSLVSRPPRIAIIIDQETDEVKDAIKALKKLGHIEVVEFKTFVREDAPNVYAHLFEPLFEEEVPAMFDESREEFPFEIIRKKRRIHERVTRIPKALQEILAVVKEMYRGSSFTEAVKKTAKQHGINVSTVRDKCTRQLSLNTAQFIEITRDKTRLKPLLQERFPYHKDLIMNEI